MKDNNKGKWLNDVFDSIKGSERAKPNDDLFGKILNKIDAPETQIIPLRQLRFAAAAAIILLVLNISLLRQNIQGDIFNTESQLIDNADEAVISNYNIYE